METDDNIGGVCGFMGLRLENVFNEAGIREDGYEGDKVDGISDFFNTIFDV